MGNDTQNNEEQFELLSMTLEDVKQGICLFQSKKQEKWIALLKERFGKEKLIVHNIADDDEKKGMVTSKDFREWANQSDARVVVVYNVQLLGMRFGDKETIEKLNFMRDQILSIGKLFVLGVTPYFDLLLSRNARDLYSCILYHFIFQDSEDGFAGMRDFDRNELAGDDALNIERYKELKERIQNDKEKEDIPLYLSCMESWNGIREYISYEENAFIATLVLDVDQYYRQKEIELSDVEQIWILGTTWLRLEETEKSVFWYEMALCLVREKLGEEHELYADALVKYMSYYEVENDFAMCDKYCNQAINVYEKCGMKYSQKGISVLKRKAVLYRIRSMFDKAIEIYEELLDYQINKYGNRYYGNAVIYNNLGRVYEEQGNFSEALEQYEKAIDLVKDTGKEGGWIFAVYQNVSLTYIKNGDVNKAWKYIKDAKKIAERVYGKDSIHLISIYNSMAVVWSEKERHDKESEYLKKALDLIEKKHMENSEVASYVYHNMGNILCFEGKISDAVLYYVRAIKIRRRVYGEQNENVALSYEQLAYAFYKLADHEEGRKNLDKARSIYLSLYGSQDENVKRIDEYRKLIANGI